MGFMDTASSFSELELPLEPQEGVQDLNREVPEPTSQAQEKAACPGYGAPSVADRTERHLEHGFHA